MKTASSIQYKKEGYLKIVKNSIEKKLAYKKLNINTLIPGFSYKNHKGETTVINNYGVL
tara:strand:+ start:747 stop:923 length:177 start_codon:yes stop_codon:yes gene_type:complete